MKEDRICIIIPAFNEALSIASVLLAIKRINTMYHIVVINDGSTDKTGQIARKHGVNVINLPFNLGIGGAVQTGLKYAKKHGFTIVVEVDADGQHDPKYIPSLLNTLKDGTDMVIGSRFIQKTQYKASLLRHTGVNIFSNLIRLACGQKIYDTTSGFRAYNQRAIAFLTELYPIDFPEPESIVKLLRNGFIIREVPVTMKQRLFGASSVTRVKAVYFMISISIAILIEAMKSKKTYGAYY